jgi:hypothetical protein
MATRSTIALEYADGTVGQIYCHWDGYLDHNGKILQGHYTDPFKVRELLDGGDTSTLSESVEDCDFYTKRGEELNPQRMYKDFQEYARECQREEYDYILRRDGKWYVSMYGTDGEYLSMQDAFEFQSREECEE